MILLHVLCIGLFVEYFGVDLLDLELGVVMELLDHIAVHLDVVSL
jgi:hypothetical protein